VSDADLQAIENELLTAGETLALPTAVARRWLADSKDARAARARLDGYAQRIADVSALDLDDAHLLPDGSF